MSEYRQTTLYESRPVTHLFYAATNGLTVKLGQTRDVTARMRSAQLRSYRLIGSLPCSCTLTPLRHRMYCAAELNSASGLAPWRLPASEVYEASGEVLRFLAFVFDDQQAQDVIAWATRHRDAFIASNVTPLHGSG